MTLEKLTTPLTIVAAVIAIVAYIKTTSVSTPSATPGMLPNPATIPTFSNIPYSQGNPATPTPPPVSQGTSYLPLIPGAGLTVNNGFGAPTQSQAAVTIALGGGGSCCGGDGETDGGNPLPGFGYYATVAQNAGF